MLDLIKSSILWGRFLLEWPTLAIFGQWVLVIKISILIFLKRIDSIGCFL